MRNIWTIAKREFQLILHQSNCLYHPDRLPSDNWNLLLYRNFLRRANPAIHTHNANELSIDCISFTFSWLYLP